MDEEKKVGMDEKPRSFFRKAGLFLKVFIPAVVLFHVVFFFIINRSEVREINFIYASVTDKPVRLVILVSMGAGFVLAYMVIWIYHMLRNRR